MECSAERSDFITFYSPPLLTAPLMMLIDVLLPGLTRYEYLTSYEYSCSYDFLEHLLK